MNAMKSTDRIYGFDPIIGQDAQVLILGTMPSVKSLLSQQYYGNPQNAFWKLMSQVLKENAEDYEGWKALLIKHHIALWDVLKSCDRLGSLDSAIYEPVPNDFNWLFSTYPSIKAVFFNGSKAEKLFPKFLRSSYGVEYYRLPSSSPACAISKDEKLRQWQILSQFI